MCLLKYDHLISLLMVLKRKIEDLRLHAPNVDESRQFTPFFVADRQASLRILAGLNLPEGKRIGIMTHANVFRPFKSHVRTFPCFDPYNCGVVDGPCPYGNSIERCPRGRRLRESTVLICDSGVFQRRGCKIPSYHSLFGEYEAMGADYGIIMDVLKDKDATLRAAQEAISTYREGSWSFKLIGVAQGNTVEEYLDCYRALKAIGYDYIAVGGMLKRKEKSARYVHVRNELLLQEILSEIRKIDPSGWLFALGCYSPQRHSFLLEHGIYGADYKGWIFQYQTVSPGRGDKESQVRRFQEVRDFIQDEVLSRCQEQRSGSRLLIIPCAKDKVDRAGTMPAYKRYDGPLYRMLRKYIHDFSNNDGLDIMILSAKYGLIAPKERIINYDQRMTPERARELAPSCKQILEDLIKKKEYERVIVNLGADYLPAIEAALQSQTIPVTFIGGRTGQRLAEVKKWILS